MAIEYKPIPGFEDAYHISEKMLVKTFPRTIKKNGLEIVLPRIKPVIKVYSTILYIWLTDNDGETKRYNLNKILEALFMPNAKKRIKHKKKEGIAIEKKPIKKRPHLGNKGKFAVIKILGDEKIEEYESLASAAKSVDGSYIRISDCCNGIRPSYKGFQWQFKN
jgi:hypothetical protein